MARILYADPPKGDFLMSWGYGSEEEVSLGTSWASPHMHF